MRLRYVLICLFVGQAVFVGCGEDADEVDVVIEIGDVHGTVTDKETGDPIEGASIDIGGKVVPTDKDGRYDLEGIPFSEKIDIVVTAANYREYKGTIFLDQEIFLFNISLVPVESPSVEILDVLEALSRDIEALDPNRIPSIKSYISEDYTAANDEATIFGVFAGVIPPIQRGFGIGADAV
jgi:hypothetical protein